MVCHSVQVWIPNPYPVAPSHKAGEDGPAGHGADVTLEKDADPSYRAGWLPEGLAGRPLWVPGQVIAAPTSSGTTVVTVATSFPQR